MATQDNPHQQIEWVPIVFVAAACYIVTLLLFAHNITEAAMQICGGVAITFSGAAAGAYGSKLLQNHSFQQRASDATPDPNPTQPNQG
jgi:hypothetical protein